MSHPAAPIQQTNPWAASAVASNGMSGDGSSWATSQATNPFAAAPPVGSMSNGVPLGGGGGQFPQPPPRSAPHLSHARSHSIDTGELSMSHQWQQQRRQPKPTLLDMANQRSVQYNGNAWPSGATASSVGTKPFGHGVDPFDVAWAAKATSSHSATTNTNTSNPFSSSNQNTQKTFEVKL